MRLHPRGLVGGKHLEGNGHAAIAAENPAQQPGLDAVVIDVVMLLADQYEAGGTQVADLGPRAGQIADRWLSGWRKRTKAMERKETLIPALKETLKEESRLLAQARQGGEYQHLGDGEILAMYDVDPEPPGPYNRTFRVRANRAVPGRVQRFVRQPSWRCRSCVSRPHASRH